MAGPVYANNSGNPVFAGTNSVVINVPASTANGDLLIAQIWQEAQTAAAPTCAGWTQAFALSGSSTQLYVFYHYASSEPASYTFTSTNATAMTGWIHRVTGAVTSGNPFNAIGSGNSGTATSITATAVTTSVANTLDMCFVGHFDGSVGVSSYQAGYTGVSYTGNSTIACSYIAQAASGSSGSATTTMLSSDDLVTVLGAISPNATTNSASIAWIV